MQIKLFNLTIRQKTLRYVAALLVAFSVLSFALAQASTQLKSPRHVTGLQLAEGPEGSRVIVLSDAMLDDYEAFRRGDRFYVRIPGAEFKGLQSSFSGDGFDDVQVQKVGDSVVVSFKLQPGANARVAQGSNRLEVIFFAPSRIVNNGTPAATRNRTTRRSSDVRSSRHDDVAGPLPPGSPTSSGPGSETNEGTVDNSQTSNRIVSAQPRSLPPAATASSSAVTGNTAVQTNSPVPASSPYSAAYPPASAFVTPAAAETRSPQSSLAVPVDWRGRSQAVKQWVLANRMVALLSGIALLSLICSVVFFLYRRRRSDKKARANMPRVQPKYSPDVDLEEMLNARVSAEPGKAAPGPYVDSETYENWGVEESLTDGFFENSAPDQEDDFHSAFTQEEEFTEMSDEQWEIPNVANSSVYQGRVQDEREVFEL